MAKLGGSAGEIEAEHGAGRRWRSRARPARAAARPAPARQPRRDSSGPAAGRRPQRQCAATPLRPGSPRSGRTGRPAAARAAGGRSDSSRRQPKGRRSSTHARPTSSTMPSRRTSRPAAARTAARWSAFCLRGLRIWKLRRPNRWVQRSSRSRSEQAPAEILGLQAPGCGRGAAPDGRSGSSPRRRRAAGGRRAPPRPGAAAADGGPSIRRAGRAASNAARATPRRPAEPAGEQQRLESSRARRESQGRCERLRPRPDDFRHAAAAVDLHERSVLRASGGRTVGLAGAGFQWVNGVILNTSRLYGCYARTALDHPGNRTIRPVAADS